MHTLATQFRAAQFYAHIAHNLASGPNFFADHAFLGELYETYEEAYDALVERMIGLGDEPDLPAITCAASKELDGFKFESTNACFAYLYSKEAKICDLIEKAMPKATEGTKNLLADMADKSEARQYKIWQRLK